MNLSPPQTDQAQLSSAFTFQRYAFAACIILAPVSISLYLVSWAGNLRQPLLDSAIAGPAGNTLHFIGAIAASFFLPPGLPGHESPGHAPRPLARHHLGSPLPGRLDSLGRAHGS